MPETPQFRDRPENRNPETQEAHNFLGRVPTPDDREQQSRKTTGEIFRALPDMKKKFSGILTSQEMLSLRISVDVHFLEGGAYPNINRRGSVSVSFVRAGAHVNLEHLVTWTDQSQPRFMAELVDDQVWRGPRRSGTFVHDDGLWRGPPGGGTFIEARGGIGAPVDHSPVFPSTLPGEGLVAFRDSINGMPKSSIAEGLQNIAARIASGRVHEHDEDLDDIFDHDDVHEDREQKEYQGKINQAAESTVAIIRYLRGGPRGANSLSELRAQANTALREAHSLPHYQNRTIREGRPTADIDADMRAAMRRIEYGPGYPEGRLDDRDIPATHIADVRIMRLPQLGETFVGRRDMLYTVSLTNRSVQQPPQLRITRSNGVIPAVEPLNVYHRMQQAE